MSAPTYSSPYNRGPVEMAPKGLRQDAERLVIQSAREFIAHLEREDEPATTPADANRLRESVRVLDVLEGKRPK